MDLGVMERRVRNIQTRLSFCTEKLSQVEKCASGKEKMNRKLRLLMTQSIRAFTNLAGAYGLVVRAAARAEDFIESFEEVAGASGSKRHHPKMLLKELHQITEVYLDDIREFYRNQAAELQTARRVIEEARNKRQHCNRPLRR